MSHPRQPRSVTERPEDEHGVAAHVPGWIHRHGYRLLVLALFATFLACFARRKRSGSRCSASPASRDRRARSRPRPSASPC